MREHSKPALSFMRRLAATLFGVWLGVNCLFCCGSAVQAQAASAADSAVQQTLATADDSCCRARLQRHEKSGGASATTRAAVQTGQFGADDAATCIRCSRLAANTARRARFLPAPARAAGYERTHTTRPCAAGIARGGSLPLNRSGTHLRCCALLI